MGDEHDIVAQQQAVVCVYQLRHALPCRSELEPLAQFAEQFDEQAPLWSDAALRDEKPT